MRIVWLCAASIQFETIYLAIASLSCSKFYSFVQSLSLSLYIYISRRLYVFVYSLVPSIQWLWFRCLLDLDLHRKYIIYITNINHLLHIKHVWLNSCVVYIVIREIVCCAPSSTYSLDINTYIQAHIKVLVHRSLSLSLSLFDGMAMLTILHKVKSLRSKFCLNSNLYELINKFQFQVENFLASAQNKCNIIIHTHRRFRIWANRQTTAMSKQHIESKSSDNNFYSSMLKLQFSLCLQWVFDLHQFACLPPSLFCTASFIHAHTHTHTNMKIKRNSDFDYRSVGKCFSFICLLSSSS